MGAKAPIKTVSPDIQLFRFIDKVRSETKIILCGLFATDSG